MGRDTKGSLPTLCVGFRVLCGAHCPRVGTYTCMSSTQREAPGTKSERMCPARRQLWTFFLPLQNCLRLTVPYVSRSFLAVRTAGSLFFFPSSVFHFTGGAFQLCRPGESFGGAWCHAAQGGPEAGACEEGRQRAGLERPKDRPGDQEKGLRATASTRGCESDNLLPGRHENTGHAFPAKEPS